MNYPIADMRGAIECLTALLAEGRTLSLEEMRDLLAVVAKSRSCCISLFRGIPNGAITWKTANEWQMLKALAER